MIEPRRGFLPVRIVPRAPLGAFGILFATGIILVFIPVGCLILEDIEALAGAFSWAAIWHGGGGSEDFICSWLQIRG